MDTVIFDMDGVIIDSEPHNKNHMILFLADHGVPKSEIDFEDISPRGSSVRFTTNKLIDIFKLDYEEQELIDRIRQSYIAYLQKLDDLDEIPGARKLINHLHAKGCKLALASSANPARIELFLTKLRLKRYFQTIVSGDEVKHSKPAPDIFLKAAQQLGSKPEKCVVIEDANFGITAAKAAGMKCIAYNGSDHNQEDLSDADVVVKDFNALVRSLQQGVLPV